jgi:glycosyltransferase involved in cell wall biosynthesis
MVSPFPLPSTFPYLPPMTRSQDSPRLSVVIPFYNEGENLDAAVEELHQAMESSPWPWELVLVDDGSRDDTLRRMDAARTRFGAHVTVVALQRNFGQTAATQAGIDAASGELVATLDGDRQNDPADIIPLARRLLSEDLDLVVGWRRNRRDGFLLRRLPSVLANRLIGRVTGVRVHDYGCSLRVYRASVLEGVRLYGEMHRFIPAWFAAATAPHRIAEEVVNHRPRVAGTSKYGIGRTSRVLLDLLSVHFFLRYWTRPGHFFGSIGLAFGGLGTAILAYLAWVKFVVGEDIGTRPLLLVGVVLVIASFQFLTTGVVAELLTRTYFESTRFKPYAVRSMAGSGGWAAPGVGPEPHRRDPSDQDAGVTASNSHRHQGGTAAQDPAAGTDDGRGGRSPSQDSAARANDGRDGR